MKNKKFIVMMLSLVMVLATAVTALAQYDDMLANGDFELNNGTNYWTVINTATIDYNSTFTNRRAVLAGGNNQNGQIEQGTHIPSGGTARLEYDYRIDSGDMCGSFYDTADVFVASAAGVTHAATLDLCSGTDTGGSYVSATALNLNAHVGQWPVTVHVIVNTDSSLPSTFYVDNMQLIWTP